MESFQPIQSGNMPVPHIDSRSEFGVDIAQVISYLHSHQASDLAHYLEKEYKGVRRYGLSEKNLKCLDDLSKFCSFWPLAIWQVCNSKSDPSQNDLKKLFVANIVLSSNYEKMSRENQQLQLRLDDMDVC